MGRPVIGMITLALLLHPAATPAESPPGTQAMTRAPAPVANRYFASIAVDTYSRARPLRGAVADAKALAQAFSQHLRFRTHADGESLSLHDAQATRDGIEALTKKGGPLDQLPADALLVVYVALHGQSNACEAGDDGVARQVCGEVLPQDRGPGDGIDIKALLNRFNLLRVRHVLLLLDTCDSGMTLGAVRLNRISYAALRHASADRKSRKVITAAALDEDADDGDGDSDRRGRFAATLLDGLSGEADLFPDGNLLFVELAIYLQAEVTRRSLADARTGKKRQQPEFGGFLSDGQGSPSLGPLDPVRGDADEALDALLSEARQHLEASEVRRAQGVLARYLLVRSRRAWLPHRVVEEAQRLAAQGRHEDAIERIDELRRVETSLSPTRQAALAQFQTRLARDAGDPADAERLATEARRVALEAGRDLDRRGRGALVDAQGAVATTIGADRAAAITAEAALPFVEPEARREVADNAAVAFDAAGEPERAASLREAEGLPPRQTLRGAPPTPNRPALVPIAAGEFVMGSLESEVGRDGDERAHRVKLTRGFVMAETEVTQAQYAALMGENPSRFQGTPNDGARPVENVNWLEAVRYCNALSEAEGLDVAYAIEGEAVTWNREADGYRLPTEAEWEYAARAGTATATYAGDLDIRGEHNAPLLDAIAWYGGNSGSEHPKAWDSSDWVDKQYAHDKASTHPVKGKQPNGWGLYDMLGNVYEWTWDWYAIVDYPPSPAGAPLADPAGPADGADRVIRGGSFVSLARWARAAYRYWWSPGVRSHGLGFRPVRAPRAP